MNDGKVLALIEQLPSRNPKLDAPIHEMRGVYAIHRRLACAGVIQLINLTSIAGWRRLCVREINLRNEIRHVELTLEPSGD